MNLLGACMLSSHVVFYGLLWCLCLYCGYLFIELGFHQNANSVSSSNRVNLSFPHGGLIPIKLKLKLLSASGNYHFFIFFYNKM